MGVDTFASAVYTDFSELNALRGQAKKDSPAAIRAAAQQFEAIFVNMMLKSMRSATTKDPIFGSDQSRFYRDMFDQQISLTMAQRGGIGLADVIARQLRRDNGQVSTETSPVAPAANQLQTYRAQAAAAATSANIASTAKAKDSAAASAAGVNAPPGNTAFSSPTQFVRALWTHAVSAARQLGLAPQAIVAQAALETGWGQHVLRHSDGSSSFNLFGIKAGTNWDGKRVAADTLEFDNGVMQRQRDTFRAYDSIAASVNDYVRLLKSSPRYRAALGSVDNAHQLGAALQRAGYATDPEYGNKINEILNSPTFKQALGELNL